MWSNKFPVATGHQNKDMSQYHAFILHLLNHGISTAVEFKASHAETGNFESCILRIYWLSMANTLADQNNDRPGRECMYT